MVTAITAINGPWPLHDVTASRALEARALAAHAGVPAPSPLMAAAGLALARLALALAPHTDSAWVAAGPGNNGGDGLIAARHLHQAGWRVQISLLADPRRLPADAAAALDQARAAGVPITAAVPDMPPGELWLDALLGLGARRPAEGAMAEAVRRLNAGPAPVLAVDLPSGLHADTGQPLGTIVRAAHTLTLLTLKPGLFTAEGRDHAGRVWLADLDVHDPAPPQAWLAGLPHWPAPSHNRHKGSFGDVLVLGGAAGMSGAAVLAARAALAAGAGRVLLARLDGDTAPDLQRPELMLRTPDQAQLPDLLLRSTVACGCGGGAAIAALLDAPLTHAPRLVLDADALNAIAEDGRLRAALIARGTRGQATVLTPHPLEAARLLGCTSATVQADRLGAAQALAASTSCTVVLKGSGSVVCAPGQLPVINPTGTARLATAGSGDVLAGWLAGLWSRHAGEPAHRVAAQVVWLHGRAGEAGDPRLPLRAADLIEQMAAAMPLR